MWASNLDIQLEIILKISFAFHARHVHILYALRIQTPDTLNPLFSVCFSSKTILYPGIFIYHWRALYHGYWSRLHTAWQDSYGECNGHKCDWKSVSGYLRGNYTSYRSRTDMWASDLESVCETAYDGMHCRSHNMLFHIDIHTKLFETVISWLCGIQFPHRHIDSIVRTVSGFPIDWYRDV